MNLKDEDVVSAVALIVEGADDTDDTEAPTGQLPDGSSNGSAPDGAASDGARADGAPAE